MNLNIIEISKTYNNGDSFALYKFSQTLEPGVYGLLGPNGAGKTTLMNILTTNLKETSGRVEWDDKPIKSLGREYRSLIGYMPQQQKLYDDFSGEEFLWYMASLKGLSKSDAKIRIDKMLDIVNLQDKKDERIKNYSGGMKQRLLIAQALLNDPKILIMDEPTAGLDPEERIRIRNFISEISEGKIVIIATHVMQDIEYIADKIILMKKGNIMEAGTPDELIRKVDGNVYEGIVNNKEIEELKMQENVLISNARYSGNERNHVRIISKDKEKILQKMNQVEPDLEDVYLFYEHFG